MISLNRLGAHIEEPAAISNEDRIEGNPRAEIIGTIVAQSHFPLLLKCMIRFELDRYRRRVHYAMLPIYTVSIGEFQPEIAVDVRTISADVDMAFATHLGQGARCQRDAPAGIHMVDIGRYRYEPSVEGIHHCGCYVRAAGTFTGCDGNATGYEYDPSLYHMKLRKK